MLGIARRRLFVTGLLVTLGLLALTMAQPRSQGPDPSASASQNAEIFDPRTDPSGTTLFGESLVVQQAGRELSINLAGPAGLQRLASFDLPDSGQFVVAHQLICADGTGPERSLVVFGAASPAFVVGSLRMKHFDGTFFRTAAGLFLFIGSEPPRGGKAWVISQGLRTVVSGSVVLVMASDPDNPAPAPCDDWDPTR